MESLAIPATLALSLVAAMGFLIGRWRREPFALREPGRRELRRARAVVRRMNDVSRRVRRNLDSHKRSVDRFRSRLNKLTRNQAAPSWRDLSDEAEQMLKPTQLLATELQHAYDDLRQQINLLMTFTEVRTDPLTGLSNRRAFNESLRSLNALNARYKKVFSLVIFDIDRFKQVNDECGHLHGDQILQQTARLLDENVRETDIVIRYGGEEFVVMMPETNLSGACVFAERLRREAEQRLPITLSGGAAAARRSDGPDDLVMRADEALYAAKQRGRNRICLHDGVDIGDAPRLALRPAMEEPRPEEAEDAATDELDCEPATVE